MAMDTPTFVGSSYSTAAVPFEAWDLGAKDVDINGISAPRRLQNTAFLAGKAIPLAVQIVETSVAKRIVKVFIVDPDDNVPLDQCMLYQGEEKLTDATDQELFFEVDIKSILEKHNAKRTSLVNKKVKDRTENLEPAKIRDLKMLVTTVASF